ncbi:LytTR family DNA-binding domain-containing protein [Leucothrix arctica]|uniref:LytTR family DNA-binding domain-containing protein n=1 Tax=Leucothrix arctica TaxID=1481894 RepID=UPI001304DB66|nr:LytTR family DNA-binding domain-containing protein [Leucothrix arctica]
MKNTPLQLTLREMKQLATAKFLLGLLGIVCILTVSAPFRTAELFGTIPLFFYWGAIASSTCFLAIFIITYSGEKIKTYGMSDKKAQLIASVIASIFVALLVCFINFTVIGIQEFSLGAFLILAGQTVLISLAVTGIFYVVASRESKQEAIAKPEEKAESTFFQRLPKALGTDVICLRAQDHYVEVTTTLGRELVLIRLSDAIQELGAEHGIQTHRSWWVMSGHVVELQRVNGKACLVLSNGNEVPISRTYGVAVKELLAS